MYKLKKILTIFTYKPFLPVLIVSLLLLIAVFLPWLYLVPPNNVLYTSLATENGFHWLGTLTFAMSLAGIVLSFISHRIYRSIGSIIIGIAGLVGIYNYYTHLVMVTRVYYGFIIAAILSIFLIIVGSMDLFKVELKFQFRRPH